MNCLIAYHTDVGIKSLRHAGRESRIGGRMRRDGRTVGGRIG